MISSVFTIVTIVVAVFLVLAVIVQNSKGGGINNAFGASNISAMIGNRRVSEGIERITWWLGGLLFACCFLATIFVSRPSAGDQDLKDAAKGTPTAAKK